MKFDIIKFIDDTCQDYLQDRHTKAYTLDSIAMALEQGSWQRDCDGKEVVNDAVEADTGTYWVHKDWCIEDKTEE